MTAHRPVVVWAGGHPRAICRCHWWAVVPNHGQFASAPNRRAA